MTSFATPRPSAWERLMMRALYDPTFWLAERAGMASRRRALLARARGRVLEIGAGTGLNAPYWPDAVEELVVTEPLDVLVGRLERRLRGAGRGGARVIAAPAERLPVPDASFDTVVSTMVLCTADDVAASLAEVRRVLRPGGRLLFMEHVRAEGGLLARAQDAAARPWRAIAGGCRCNQPTLDLIRAAGFSVVDVQEARWRAMPFPVRPLRIGEAW